LGGNYEGCTLFEGHFYVGIVEFDGRRILLKQTPRNKYFVLTSPDLRVVTFKSRIDKSPQIIIDSRSRQLNSGLAKPKSEECIFAYMDQSRENDTFWKTTAQRE
jgi:hypothetical protein